MHCLHRHVLVELGNALITVEVANMGVCHLEKIKLLNSSVWSANMFKTFPKKGRLFPSLLTPIMKAMANSFQDPEKAKKAMTKAVKKMVKPDREALLAPGAMEALLASSAEAYRQGVKGAVYEGGLYGRNWSFHLENLAFQPLYLWHGELDTNVAVAMARAVAGKLPNCNATFYPDDAHISVPLKHQEEIVSALFSLLS